MSACVQCPLAPKAQYLLPGRRWILPLTKERAKDGCGMARPESFRKSGAESKPVGFRPHSTSVTA